MSVILQWAGNHSRLYKIAVSILLGVLGFELNFHTIIFPFGPYTVAILFGLLFPLLITLSWGWKYGLLSALAGGCQSMWWLWGPSNGYAVIPAVLPFTLWIVWHGWMATLRETQGRCKWWTNPYAAEILFRIFSTINLFTLARWAVSFNPPPWTWAANAPNSIPWDFSTFVVIKQGAVGFTLLLMADVLLHLTAIRKLFLLERLAHSEKTGHIVSFFVLLGCLWWVADSAVHALAFSEGRSFIDFLVLDIPAERIFNRGAVFVFCMISGLYASSILRRQKQGENALLRAKEEAEAAIREKSKTLAELVSETTRRKSLMDVSQDGIAIFNDQHRVVEANKRFCDMLGYTPEEIKSLRTWDFESTLSEEEIRAAFKDLEQVHSTFETRHRRKDGSMYDAEVSAAGAQIGGAPLVFTITRDISSRIAAEEEKRKLDARLLQAQKMEAIGTLAGGIAHDFNNILSGMFAYCDLAKRHLDSPERAQGDIEGIVGSAKRASDLVRQILTFCRKSTQQKHPFPMYLEVKEALKLLRSTIPSTIQIQEDITSKASIMAEPQKIHQVVMNLCTNAYQAMAETGGVLGVSLKEVELSEKDTMLNPDLGAGSYLKLEISDTGSGMDNAVKEKIFEPYFTTKGKGKGTGLGLAVVHGIVKEHGGAISVYSEPGQGTSFYVYFPVTGVQADDGAYNGNDISISGSEKILLVDDEILLLNAMAQLLDEMGYSIVPFSNASDALKAYQDDPASFDIVVTDMTMPAMTGLELSEQILRINPEQPIILCTGHSELINKRKALETGIRRYYEKPIIVAKLAAAIRDVLDAVY